MVRAQYSEQVFYKKIINVTGIFVPVMGSAPAVHPYSRSRNRKEDIDSKSHLQYRNHLAPDLDSVNDTRP
jgi:hypothetical protein